jgi:RNA polymerase sigma factor (sigma-70 family)
MSDQAGFAVFMQRIRAGEEPAAAELVRQYESLIRRAIRLRLEDRGLRRLFDSMDVCQSVLASFFVRSAAGQYDLDSPEQLTKLLVTMAKNHLISAARRQRSLRRDHRRIAPEEANNLDLVAARESTPSQKIAGQELLGRFQQEMTDEEKQIADLRSQGLDWAGVASVMGGNAQARRMQLARALDRITQTLGLEQEVYPA